MPSKPAAIFKWYGICKGENIGLWEWLKFFLIFSHFNLCGQYYPDDDLYFVFTSGSEKQWGSGSFIKVCIARGSRCWCKCFYPVPKLEKWAVFQVPGFPWFIPGHCSYLGKCISKYKSSLSLSLSLSRVYVFLLFQMHELIFKKYGATMLCTVHLLEIPKRI